MRADFFSLVKGEKHYAQRIVLRKRLADDLSLMVCHLVFECVSTSALDIFFILVMMSYLVIRYLQFEKQYGLLPVSRLFIQQR